MERAGDSEYIKKDVTREQVETDETTRAVSRRSARQQGLRRQRAGLPRVAIRSLRVVSSFLLLPLSSPAQSRLEATGEDGES